MDGMDSWENGYQTGIDEQNFMALRVFQEL